MENRDKDKMTRNREPTEAEKEKLNRDTSKNQSPSNVEFGEKIGRSEILEIQENEPSRGTGRMSGNSRSSNRDIEH